MEQYWGERFKLGGLAGYCHGGKTGIGAVSHHVPNLKGLTSHALVLYCGPHIGVQDGVWGKVVRKGMTT